MGAMGGAYPLPSLLAGCILAPPTKSRTRSSLWVPWEPTQFHGNHGPGPREGLVCWSGAVSMNAQGPWPPAGGGKTLARRLCIWGVGVSPLPVPYVPPGMAPPILGVLRRAFYYRCLPIFRTFLGDLVGRFVVLEFYSHDCLSTRLFFFQNSSSGGITSSNE